MKFFPQFWIVIMMIFVNSHGYAHVAIEGPTGQTHLKALYYKNGTQLERFLCPSDTILFTPSNCQQDTVRSVNFDGLYQATIARVSENLPELDTKLANIGAEAYAIDGKIEEVIIPNESIQNSASIKELKQTVENFQTALQELAIQIRSLQEQISSMEASLRVTPSADLQQQLIMLRTKLIGLRHDHDLTLGKLESARNTYVQALHASDEDPRLKLLRDRRLTLTADYQRLLKTIEDLSLKRLQAGKFLTQVLNDASFVYEVTKEHLRRLDSPYWEANFLHEDFETTYIAEHKLPANTLPTSPNPNPIMTGTWQDITTSKDGRWSDCRSNPDRCTLVHRKQELWFTPVGGRGTYFDARRNCRELNFNGAIDWRLPTLQELSKVSGDAFNKAGPFLTPSSSILDRELWASSGEDQNSDSRQSYAIKFIINDGSYYAHDPGNNYRYLCVRNGELPIKKPCPKDILCDSEGAPYPNPMENGWQDITIINHEKAECSDFQYKQFETKPSGECVFWQKKTGLYWMMLDIGGGYTFEEAKKACKAVVSHDIKKWRLVSFSDVSHLKQFEENPVFNQLELESVSGETSIWLDSKSLSPDERVSFKLDENSELTFEVDGQYLCAACAKRSTKSSEHGVICVADSVER